MGGGLASSSSLSSVHYSPMPLSLPYTHHAAPLSHPVPFHHASQPIDRPVLEYRPYPTFNTIASSSPTPSSCSPHHHQPRYHHHQQQQPRCQQPQQPPKSKVRLIYAKSGFYLRPNAPMENHTQIHGLFAIVFKNIRDIQPILLWIPEDAIDSSDIHSLSALDGLIASEQDFPYLTIDLNGKDITAIGLESVDSLYLRPPSTEQGALMITTRAGDLLKTLWYDSKSGQRQWPGYNIIDILGIFTHLERDVEEHVLRVLLPHEYNERLEASRRNSSISLPHTSLQESIRGEIEWTVMERLARITEISRSTSAYLFEAPLDSSVAPSTSHAYSLLTDHGTVRTTMNEYSVAGHYLSQCLSSPPSRRDHSKKDLDSLLVDMPEMQEPLPPHDRHHPISPETWVDLFDTHGRLKVTESQVRAMIFQAGLHPDVRIEAWKFLLDIYPWDSTFDEREAIRESITEEYHKIKAKWFNDTKVRNSKEFLEEKHRINKDVHRTDREIVYFQGEDLPNPDSDMSVGTNANLEIMKDILVTYNFYNTTLGYVQGMSDLLAPLLVAMGDEAMAFWVFVKFMDRMKLNFLVDQSGMHAQLKRMDSLIRFMDPALYEHFKKTETADLFFCFRWLLVWFKREMEWEDVIRLWEVLWTDHLSTQFILFVAFAVLEEHRQTILDDTHQFDELLRYINDLSGTLDLQRVLERAQRLFYQFQRKMSALNRKKTYLRQIAHQTGSERNREEYANLQASLQTVCVDANLQGLLKSAS
ncbi:rab-GTPase-TBC domain-containing protein [Spinellus fusiger]|nr:rab-GTPase-TBC domain-containing protein [Spinellus fusiger]